MIHTFFLKMSLVAVGIVSPIRNPHGLRDSMRSKINFIIAISGIEMNIPGTPHRTPKAITAIIDTSAFIFTLDATILGTI